MARHKNDATTTRLLDAMPATRAELLTVVDALKEQGVTRNELATAAGWNPGYLSEFLSKEGKNPTTRKLVSLVKALQVLVVTKGANPAVTAALQRTVDRYELSSVRLTSPASGPVAVTAPNYVHREELETSLHRAVATPGSYAIDGQPMTGVSSTLLFVESLLEARGIQTCRLSARVDLVETRRIERSATGVLGALAAATTGSDEALARDFYGAQEAIRDRFTVAPEGFALLLDDLNDMDPKDLQVLKSIMRDWATKRAAGTRGYVNTTLWLAYTSNVREVAIRSQFLAEYVMTDPFRQSEVLALAEALAPFATAAGVTSSPGDWATAVARSAFELFGGQPHLTHLFLWDRHHDGATGLSTILSDPPAGAYQRHLDRLARSFVGLLSHARAAVVLERLRETGTIKGHVSVSEWQAIERLGLVGIDGRWSSEYYKAQLPREIAAAIPGAV